MSNRIHSVRERVLTWLKPPRTLAINASGWYFIAFIFAVGLAAVNTGNNLLYLILGGMLSFIVASGILSNMDLKNLVVSRRLPEYLFARTPVLVRVEIENRKRRIPSFILLVETMSPMKAMTLIPTIRPHGRAEGFLEVVFPKRGILDISPLKVSTKFPFGLFTKGMEAAGVQRVLVFPRLSNPDIPVSDSGGWEGESVLLRSGQGSDPFSIKDFLPGDNPRHIHWKSTAKRGKYMRREFSMEREPKATIRIDAGAGLSENLLEDKIERAASLSARFIREGYSVAVSCGAMNVPFGRGNDHLLIILRELALFDADTVDRVLPATTVDEGMVIEL